MPRWMLRVLWTLVVVLPGATLLLWWLGSLPDEEHPAVGRVVFGNIPDPLVALFYLSSAVFVGVIAYFFAVRARNWARGAQEHRGGQWWRRIRELERGLTQRSVMERLDAGPMHAMIYYGFLVLFLGTVTLELDHIAPTGLKFLEGRVYQAYSAILDGAGVVFLAGLGWAAVRRYLVRPLRVRTKTRPEDGVVLAVLALIGLSGLLVEAARITLDGRPAFETWSFVGYPLSAAVPESSAAGIHQVLWLVHFAAFLALLVIIPTTKLRHMFTAPLNMTLAPRERPKGAMREMPNLLEVTDIESIGASRVGEFTWKQLLDTDACTICGRCTSVCPANQTGKPLDPREIVLKLGEVAARTASPRLTPPVGMDGAISISSDSVFERITAEELWACTSCRACDEVCPVDIEILDKILDMRRYLTLMESDFPAELGATFRSLENSSNPYSLSQQNRADWTAGLGFEVKRLGEPGVTAEYLYWVGCAGSFDDRNRKVTVSTARLLHEAGVDFAILGPMELCTGDPARRAGNEYLFQQLATQNIRTLNDLGVTKVITQCPHCFNTLSNEYPSFGGEYEVMHHSELLMELVKEGRLKPKNGGGQTVTFHDPCYLGRHNDVFAAPRKVLQLVGDVVEMPRNGTNSFCCGAGGARMWMEEDTGKRVNVERAEEAVATGSDVIATGCPFCFVMLDDGVKEIGADVAVKDLAMLLAERTLD
ncbi:MAG: respiratory nitrate reductase subunit gamma [Acidimicrobiia bacterium]|nr:respiratory nitrate reductase subunit gamma [Acidimicrobiia bacterium]